MQNALADVLSAGRAASKVLFHFLLSSVKL